MSSESVIALVAVVVSGVVGVAGLGFNLLNSHQDRQARLKMQAAEHEESYRAQSYDKRLEVHQEGFEWTQKLGRAAFLVSQDQNSPETKRFLEGTATAQRWLEKTFLYLDPVSGERLTTLFRMFMRWGLGMIDDDDSMIDGDESKEGLLAATPPRVRFLKAIQDKTESAQSALVNGIGLKHIDFEGIAADMRRAREEKGNAT